MNLSVLYCSLALVGFGSCYEKHFQIKTHFKFILRILKLLGHIVEGVMLENYIEWHFLKHFKVPNYLMVSI